MSSTCQWLTTSLTIGGTPYRTHWPSDSLIYVCYIARCSNLLLHAYRLGATMGLVLMTWPPRALPRAMPLSLNPTIGRYLSLEST